MAGAQEAAGPVVGQRGLSPGSKAFAGGTPQVRTDADHHQVFGFDGTMLVLGVLRRGDLVVAVGIRIQHLGLGLVEGFEHLGSAANQPDRLATPFHPTQFARRHAGDVGLDRSAGRLGPLGRLEGADQRDGHACSPRTPDHAGGNQRSAPGGIHACLGQRIGHQGEPRVKHRSDKARKGAGHAHPADRQGACFGRV